MLFPCPNHGFRTFEGAQVGSVPPNRVLDKRTESARERRAWDKVRRADIKYGRQLRSVAVQIGNIIAALSPDGVADVPLVEQAMRRYSEMLEPWAKAVGGAMIMDVSRRDEAVWASLAQDMSRGLREEILTAPMQEANRLLLAEQVKLIKSMPTEAAERVHHLTQEALVSGKRASEVAKEIMRSGDVTKSRATLIARTEVARTASGMVQARATHVGSEGYIWRTAMDRDVRKSHKQMRGKFVPWTRPPVLDKMTGHAGQFPNCRCYPEPVVPDFKDIN
jgi:SPP1 gp7 family putative phage head morphogenesis protein